MNIRLYTQLYFAPPYSLIWVAFLSPCLVRADTNVILYFYSPSEGHLNYAPWQGNTFAPYNGMWSSVILGFHATAMGSEVALTISQCTNGNSNPPEAQILYLLRQNGVSTPLIETVAHQIPIVYQDTLWGSVYADTFPPHPVISTYWRNLVIAWEQIGSTPPEDSTFLIALRWQFHHNFDLIPAFPPTQTVVQMRSGGSWMPYLPHPSQHPLTLQFPALAVRHSSRLAQATAWTLWSHTRHTACVAMKVKSSLPRPQPGPSGVIPWTMRYGSHSQTGGMM